MFTFSFVDCRLSTGSIQLENVSSSMLPGFMRLRQLMMKVCIYFIYYCCLHYMLLYSLDVRLVNRSKHFSLLIR